MGVCIDYFMGFGIHSEIQGLCQGIWAVDLEAEAKHN
jgi:hypothetical protein